MASKYENQMKEIGGLVFTSHEYKNRKLRITVEIGKTVYQHFVCTQTWKNAKDSKQSTFNRLSWRFKKYFKIIKQEIQIYLPVPIDKVRLENFYGNLEQPYWTMINDEFGKAITLKEIKSVYKKYSKRLHPDTNKTINALEFKTLKGLYDIFVEQRIMLVNICKKNGIDMEY